MPKRKATTEAEETSTNLRRSTRRRSSALNATSLTTDEQKAGKNQKTVSAKPSGVKPRPNFKATKSVTSGSTNPATTSTDGTSIVSGNQWFWLMKAEPESRFENGSDVRFSIDDLEACTEPEPWDGIRAYAARNNLRSMKKGELAFFYHSNCKEPGIVGTMEIVKEHSPDLTAHNPKAPYYDAKSKPEDPKWSVVHVKFRSKFAQPIELKELREMGKPGQPLENMQMLKQSRLSVSRVSPHEWEYLVGVAAERGGEVS
ncbi:DUF55-domain-containing protein [Xylariaceae sp. FL0016]|nr:DUF55-domain-containing protein [Xylariaceae sp. FL0016]